MNRGDRFMLLVIFINVACCIFHFLNGDVSAGIGWLVASMWSVKAHGLEVRMREKEKEGDGEDDDFTRFYG